MVEYDQGNKRKHNRAAHLKTYSTGNINTQNKVRNQNIQDEIAKKDSFKN